ncbi:MAG: dihydropteroate synthase [Pirellulales bacterium]|nr:dihydropteroate synthase [Pirellulales bacterium]
MKNPKEINISSINNITLKCGTKTIDLSKPLIMGILNLTPDSFYDGGKYNSEKDILCQTEKMINEGAAIIDIGAVSTRPGAEDISEKEEIKKLTPVIKSLKNHFPSLTISVDTYRSTIAENMINNGADIINDISGGCFDKKMLEIIAKYDVPYILMHIKGTPKNMQKNPVYTDVVKEIKDFFKTQLSQIKKIKGNTNNIILDPGFGFGKTLEHNYQILNNLKEFKTLGQPILVGVSRKSMINKLLNTTPAKALNGTTVLNTISLLNGANILRVHDVKEAVEAVKIVGIL